jgi:DNA-directed RNA polymerase specialized sigma24 family protein
LTKDTPTFVVKETTWNRVCPNRGLPFLFRGNPTTVFGTATAAARADVKARLEEALGRMDTTDREVLALRHYEHLTSSEAAQVLGIQDDATLIDRERDS